MMKKLTDEQRQERADARSAILQALPGLRISDAGITVAFEQGDRSCDLAIKSRGEDSGFIHLEIDELANLMVACGLRIQFKLAELQKTIEPIVKAAKDLKVK